jgi:hypothetical protein
VDAVARHPKDSLHLAGAEAGKTERRQLIA